MKTKLTTLISIVHLPGIFYATVLGAMMILVGCQTPANMTTRILPPSTQLSGQQYYQQAPSAATSVDLGVPADEEVPGADSWSPRARRPIQIASEPDGRQASFEHPLDVSNPTQDSDVIRISIGDGESTASENYIPVVVERPNSEVPFATPLSENDQWMTRQ
ncbi:MAG: hypothetical protein NZ744_06740 [Pirellulaceae bacterium]|nr:hypothetical protein [Pirellulaceae bacterium]